MQRASIAQKGTFLEFCAVVTKVKAPKLFSCLILVVHSLIIQYSSRKIMDRSGVVEKSSCSLRIASHHVIVAYHVQSILSGHHARSCAYYVVFLLWNYCILASRRCRAGMRLG